MLNFPLLQEKKEKLVVDLINLFQIPSFLFDNDISKQYFLRETLPNLIESVIRILSMNPARQRRKLEKFLLEWNSMNKISADIEAMFQTKLKTKPLSLFTQMLSYRLIAHYMQLGFVLDLYESNEIYEIFSSISEIFHRCQKYEEYADVKIFPLKNKKKNSKKAIKAAEKSPSKLRIAQFSAFHSLYKALASHSLALCKDNNLPIIPTYAQQGRAARFLQRFYPLIRLDSFSIVVNFDEQKKRESGAPLAQMLSSASALYKQANTDIASYSKQVPEEESKQVQSILKSCVMNNLSAQRRLLSKEEPTKKDSSRTCISVSYEIHPLFPILSVTSW